jgi:phage-related protein
MSTFYNRDQNISGIDIPSSLYYKPQYGSKVTFSSKVHMYETDDGNYNIIPMSINSLTAKFDLKFSLDELNTQKLVSFIESKNGANSFILNDPSNIYRPLEGFSSEYSINHINKNHYETMVGFDVYESPDILNWSGMSFLNYNLKNYSTSGIYKKYDVVYFPKNSNKLNNFFYCTGDHTSSPQTSPTGLSSQWTQSFFFKPDIGVQNSVQFDLGKIEFKNSFMQNVKTKNNIARININYKFNNISNQHAKSILHYLENKCGYRRFLVNIDSVYNRSKVYMCPSWTHTWNFYNSNDIEIQLVEDVLGIIPTTT